MLDVVGVCLFHSPYSLFALFASFRVPSGQYLRFSPVCLVCQEVRVEVGVGLPNTLAGADGELLRAWACRADSGPFASLGVFDRLVYDSADALTTLAVAAGLTTRIRLATTVL